MISDLILLLFASYDSPSVAISAYKFTGEVSHVAVLTTQMASAKLKTLHAHHDIIPRALPIKKFWCLFSVIRQKIEEGEKAGTHRQSNPRYLWLEPQVLCH